MDERTPDDLVARTDMPARWPAIGERLAKRLTDDRRIRSWRIGARVWVSAADVETWLATCRRDATV